MSNHEDVKCHWCQGCGEKTNPHTGDEWRCDPCQGTGEAQFYTEAAKKFRDKPYTGIYALWCVGDPKPIGE